MSALVDYNLRGLLLRAWQPTRPRDTFRRGLFERILELLARATGGLESEVAP